MTTDVTGPGIYVVKELAEKEVFKYLLEKGGEVQQAQVPSPIIEIFSPVLPKVVYSIT